MGKLVRDRIPDIVAAGGGRQHVRRLDDADYAHALVEKLVEEANELRTAAEPELLGEAADVYEVLLAILALRDLNADALAQAARAKRQDRGAFAERWWWEAVD